MPSRVEVLVAMSLIGLVTICCILQGIDGNVAYIGIVGIAGLGGYQIKEENKNAS